MLRILKNKTFRTHKIKTTMVTNSQEVVPGLREATEDLKAEVQDLDHKVVVPALALKAEVQALVPIVDLWVHQEKVPNLEKDNNSPTKKRKRRRNSSLFLLKYFKKPQKLEGGIKQWRTKEQDENAKDPTLTPNLNSLLSKVYYFCSSKNCEHND